jgi:hypothetical protein
VTLGAKSELKKWEAEKKVQEIIDRESAGPAFRPEPNVSTNMSCANSGSPASTR